MSEIDEESLVYVDQTGFDQFLYREYAWAPRDQRAYSEVSGRKYKRSSIVAGKCKKHIFAPLQYDGTMNSQLMEWWFETQLLKEIPRGSTVVLDNARFHRKTGTSSFSRKSWLFYTVFTALLSRFESN